VLIGRRVLVELRGRLALHADRLGEANQNAMMPVHATSGASVPVSSTSLLCWWLEPCAKFMTFAQKY
jgi:hypothetical protein